MKGIIGNYCRSRHVTSGNKMVIIVAGVDSREAASKLVGKKVAWNTGKRAINGSVASAHGNSGALRVAFETGMPGQCIGQEVQIN